jgi:hypothetical protein
MRFTDLCGDQLCEVFPCYEHEHFPYNLIITHPRSYRLVNIVKYGINEFRGMQMWHTSYLTNYILTDVAIGQQRNSHASDFKIIEYER